MRFTLPYKIASSNANTDSTSASFPLAAFAEFCTASVPLHNSRSRTLVASYRPLPESINTVLSLVRFEGESGVVEAKYVRNDCCGCCGW